MKSFCYAAQCSILKISFLLLFMPLEIPGRILNRCTMAHELLQLGLPREELPLWICIANYESKLNTTAIGRLNGNWSNDFGIFQLSDRYWCVSRATRASANLCNINCHLLLADDLRESVRCAKLVRDLQGWQAWAVYRGLCERRSKEKHWLEDVEKCFLN